MVGPENSVVGVDLDAEALSSRRSDAPQRRPQTSSSANRICAPSIPQSGSSMLR
jgi:hypothetical protein